RLMKTPRAAHLFTASGGARNTRMSPRFAGPANVLPTMTSAISARQPNLGLAQWSVGSMLGATTVSVNSSRGLAGTLATVAKDARRTRTRTTLLPPTRAVRPLAKRIEPGEGAQAPGFRRRTPRDRKS